MFAQLKPQIDSLCTMAGQGSDPIGAADLLYDQLICDLPDEIYDKVAEMIESPNFIRNAAVFNPAVNTVKDWFEKLRAQVILRINQADAEAGQEPTQP